MLAFRFCSCLSCRARSLFGAASAWASFSVRFFFGCFFVAALLFVAAAWGFSRCGAVFVPSLCLWLAAFLLGLGGLALVSVPLFFAVPLFLRAVLVVARPVFFVRFVSPWAASWGLVGWRGSGFGFRCGSWRWAPPSAWGLGVRGSWVCVSPAALSALSGFGFCARPALVSRRSGVVLRFWVFVTTENPKSNKSKNTSVKNSGVAIAPPQNPTTTLDKFVIACYITFVATG